MKNQEKKSVKHLGGGPAIVRFVGLLLMVLVALAASLTCSKSGDDPEQNKFVVMSNTSDPLIATCTTLAGETVDFYGQRNGNGVPTKIDQIIVNKDGKTTYFKLDDTARPIKIIAPDGTEFEFNWTSAQKAVLTVLTSDGQNQINTDIDFSKPAATPLLVHRNRSTRTHLALKPEYPNCKNEIKKASATQSTSSGNCTVCVTSCGSPADADVWVLLNDQFNKLLGMFPASRVSKGTYVANIPTNLAPTINPSEICGSIAGVLEKACYVAQVPNLPLVLCTSLSAAIATTGIGAPIAATIMGACASVTAGLELYCSTLGASPAEGAPSLADLICAADILNRNFALDIQITARASAIPSSAYSQTYTVSGSGPFPTLNVDLGSKTSIRTLTLNPSSPAAEQFYVATADIFCLLPNTSVTLAIVGTDGYTDSINYYISANQPEGSFTLTVPGAESGVQDVVTVNVVLPSGATLTRTASLVFH